VAGARRGHIAGGGEKAGGGIVKLDASETALKVMNCWPAGVAEPVQVLPPVI
jgi:hypothetical protein